MAMNVDVPLCNFFHTLVYSTSSNCQKFAWVVQKWLGMIKFVCTKRK